MENVRDELKAFNTVIKEVDSLYSELARRSDLADSAFWVFYYLALMEEKITQKSICEQWYLSKQTVNNAIRDMQKKGYIRLLESASDRRSKELSLTESGEAFVSEHIKSIFTMEEKIFSQMTEEERRSLISINAKYLQLLRQEIHGK